MIAGDARVTKQTGFEVEMIHLPNPLAAKVGPRAAAFEADAIVKAEAALKELSLQFSSWVDEEINHLTEARAAIAAEGLNDKTATRLYSHTHDLKGLGGTVDFPLVSRIAASLCRLMSEPEKRSSTPLPLIDAHLDAIRAVVREDIRDAEHPVGTALSSELERRVSEFKSTQP